MPVETNLKEARGIVPLSGSTGFVGSALQVDANPGAAGIVGNAQAAAEQESR